MGRETALAIVKFAKTDSATKWAFKRALAPQKIGEFAPRWAAPARLVSAESFDECRAGRNVIGVVGYRVHIDHIQTRQGHE